MSFKGFKLTTNSDNITVHLMPNTELTLVIRDMYKKDILVSNFSLEELSEYLKKQRSTKQSDITYQLKQETFIITTSARELEMNIAFSGKTHFSIPRLNKWDILKERFSPEEIAAYLQDRLCAMQMNNFFNGDTNEFHCTSITD